MRLSFSMLVTMIVPFISRFDVAFIISSLFLIFSVFANIFNSVIFGVIMSACFIISLKPLTIL